MSQQDKSRGEKNPNAKLKIDQVVNIRKQINEGISVSEIARIHQVHRTTISCIKLNKTWIDIY
jgi:DNA invertase Pin-like site-specific DNA recombinase